MKLIDITPLDLRCYMGEKCPTVYEEGENFVIIGKKLSEKDHSTLENKIGDDEYVIRIPKKYFPSTAEINQ